MLLTARFLLKKELMIVLGTLGFLVLLPILAVTTLLTSGLSAVSGSLVSSNPTTQDVTVYNPNGSVKTILQASTVWPVHGPVSLEFGADDSPYQLHHTGIDIAVPIGTPVAALMAGTVTKTGYDSSEGNFVYADSGNGIAAHYLHLSSVLVTSGRSVTAGTLLGLSGGTGWVTGPHLHFEIRVDSVPVNPREFMVGNP